jgi:hypothetical protein
MAERKKGSKVQKRGKLRRGNSAKRGKARKVAKTAKRTAARAKPKPAPVKNAARKVKQPDAVVEVIERPAPGVIAVTEVEETEVRKASWRCCDLTATLRKNYALPSRDWLTPLDLGRTMLALRFCLFLFVCYLFVGRFEKHAKLWNPRRARMIALGSVGAHRSQYGCAEHECAAIFMMSVAEQAATLLQVYLFFCVSCGYKAAL